MAARSYGWEEAGWEKVPWGNIWGMELLSDLIMGWILNLTHLPKLPECTHTQRMNFPIGKFKDTCFVVVAVDTWVLAIPIIFYSTLIFN